MNAQLLTVAELAVYLQVSVRHLERCASLGMPSISVGARSKRYDAHACLNWLATNAETALCQSPKPKMAATASLSASAVSDYTAAFRRAHLRVMPSDLNPS